MEEDEKEKEQEEKVKLLRDMLGNGPVKNKKSVAAIRIMETISGNLL